MIISPLVEADSCSVMYQSRERPKERMVISGCTRARKNFTCGYT